MGSMIAARAALVLTLLPLPLLAQGQGDVVSPLIGRMEAGILCAPPATGTQEAPGTIAGQTNLVDVVPPFVSRSRQVPAALGVGFGVKSAAKGAPLDVVTIVVTHPPMGPEGVTRQEYTSWITSAEIAATEGLSASYYHLEYDYEMVLGDWTFSALLGDEVLWSVAFEVVPPGAVPELAGICGYADLLS